MMGRVSSSESQEGATATTFLLTLFALLGVALLAIDGGFLLVSRRGQVADTDSAVLAAARELASNCQTGVAGQTALNAAADRLLRLNDPGLGPTETTRVGDVAVEPSLACPATSAVVTVTTRRPAPTVFGPLFGFDDQRTGVVSKATIGPGVIFPGVRPIGICVNNPHYIAWRNYYQAITNTTAADDAPAAAAYFTHMGGPDHPATSGNGVHRMAKNKSSVNLCGLAPGNWEWLDFDGTTPGSCENRSGDNRFNTELPCRVIEGSEYPLQIGDDFTAVGDCNIDRSDIGPCPPDTGSRASIGAALGMVDCPTGPWQDCPHQLMFVVYDFLDPCEGQGPSCDPDAEIAEFRANGQNAEFRVRSVVTAVIRGYKMTGREDDRYIDLEFINTITQGQTGSSSTPINTESIVVQLCGTATFDNC